jgi:hypothetical protein
MRKKTARLYTGDISVAIYRRPLLTLRMYTNTSNGSSIRLRTFLPAQVYAFGFVNSCLQRSKRVACLAMSVRLVAVRPFPEFHEVKCRRRVHLLSALPFSFVNSTFNQSQEWPLDDRLFERARFTWRARELTKNDKVGPKHEAMDSNNSRKEETKSRISARVSSLPVRRPSELHLTHCGYGRFLLKAAGPPMTCTVPIARLHPPRPRNKQTTHKTLT